MRDAAEVEQSPLWRSITAAEGAVAAAHRTYLKVAQDSADLFARHAAYELELIEASKRSWAERQCARTVEARAGRAARVANRTRSPKLSRICRRLSKRPGKRIFGGRLFPDAGSPAR